MKLLHLVILFAICAFSYGSDWSELISSKDERTYEFRNTITLAPVKKSMNGRGGGGIDFESFEINHIRIRKYCPVLLYYANGHIMPPCLFVQVPVCPSEKSLFKIKRFSEMRSKLGREHNPGDASSSWCFFEVSHSLIKVMRIKVSHLDDQINGISIYEATGNIEDLVLKE